MSWDERRCPTSRASSRSLMPSWGVRSRPSALPAWRAVPVVVARPASTTAERTSANRRLEPHGALDFGGDRRVATADSALAKDYFRGLRMSLPGIPDRELEKPTESRLLDVMIRAGIILAVVI